MNWLKKAWDWLKRHWKWVASGVAVLLAVSAGATIIRDQKKKRIQSYKIRAMKAEREVARLEGKREVIRKQQGDVEAEMSIIDAEVEKLNKEIEVSRGEVDRLTSKEKLEEFRRLGYGGDK